MVDVQKILESFPGSIPEDKVEAARLFDEEWNKAVSVLAAVTNVDDPKVIITPPGSGPAPPHMVLAEAVDEWRQVRCPWDRRRALVQMACQASNIGLTTWRRVNLYCFARLPHQGLAYLESMGKPNRFDRTYAEHCGAYARAYLGLTRYAEALDWATKASEADLANRRLKIVLADALMLSGDCDKANAIYSAFMSKSAPLDGDVDPIKDMFDKLLARDTGAVGSPVFAVTIAESIADPGEAEQLWNLVEVEFFDSPYCRLQHAYYLLKHGQRERAFAKILALTFEMPWVKEAAINATTALDASGKTDEQSKRLRAEIQARIDRNGWSTDGMHGFKVE